MRHRRTGLGEGGASASPDFFPVRRVVDDLVEPGWLVIPVTRMASWCCTRTRTTITSRATTNSSDGPSLSWWARTG